MEHTSDGVRHALSLGRTLEVRTALAEMDLPHLLEVWSDLDEEEELALLPLLDMGRKVDLMTELSPHQQELLVQSLTRESTRAILEEMDPDDVTDLFQSVSPQVRDRVWHSLSEEARREMQFLLKFDEDDAAGLMTPRCPALRATTTVSEAIAWIRKHSREVETVYYIYVVDALKRLTGVVSLRDLLLADDATRIREIMVQRVVSVYDDTDQEEAARILEAHDLLAVPVTDHAERLLGIVTFDDVFDVIRDEQTEDMYKMGAMAGDTERYLDSSVWALVRKRIPWLAILLLAATLTTNVLSHFRGLFEAAIVLTLFIPTVTGAGGNAGTQSSTLMIRGLARNEIHPRDFRRVMAKEVFVGLCIGASLGALVFLRSLLLPPFVAPMEALAVGVALSLVLVVSTLLGAAAPLVISRMGFDPTVMAGPLMATIIDVSGLTIYFLTARALLGLV